MPVESHRACGPDRSRRCWQCGSDYLDRHVYRETDDGPIIMTSWSCMDCHANVATEYSDEYRARIEAEERAEAERRHRQEADDYRQWRREHERRGLR